MASFRLGIAAALLLTACGGTRTGDDTRLEPEKEKLIDELTLFVEAVQGDRFDRAMDYLTAGEKAKITEGTGVVPPPMQRRLKAVRLSTLAQKPGVRLVKGKLDGIYAWLPNVEAAPGPATREIPPPLP